MSWLNMTWDSFGCSKYVHVVFLTEEFLIPLFPLRAVFPDVVIINKETHVDKFSVLLRSSIVQIECCECFLPFWKPLVWVVLVCVIISCGMEAELFCDWSMCYWFTICEMPKDTQSIYAFWSQLIDLFWRYKQDYECVPWLMCFEHQHIRFLTSIRTAGYLKDVSLRSQVTYLSRWGNVWNESSFTSGGVKRLLWALQSCIILPECCL